MIRTALILVVCLGTVGVGTAHADSPALDQLATRLVGAPTTVSCFTPDNVNDGYVLGTLAGGKLSLQHVIHLAGDECGALTNALSGSARVTAWLSQRDEHGAAVLGAGLLAITHEALHVSLQSADEGRVECTAYRNLWSSVHLLPLNWKLSQLVYRWAALTHHLMKDRRYRTVC